MSSDPQQDRPKLDLQPTPKEPLNLPSEASGTEPDASASTPAPDQTPETTTDSTDLEKLQAEKAALLAEIAELKAEKEA